MTGIIIQARLGSGRLPGKSFLYLGGRTIVHRVIEICRQSKEADVVVVATPDKEIADYIGRNFKDVKVSLWAYPNRDVLGEFYYAAKCFGLDVIARITADCPMHRADVIDYVINGYRANKGCYVYNRCDSKPNSWPDGLDCECFSFKMLEEAYDKSALREHVCTPYMIDNFQNVSLEPFEDFDPNRYFSINTVDDYKRALALIV